MGSEDRRIQDHPWLCSELEASLDPVSSLKVYIMITSVIYTCMLYVIFLPLLKCITHTMLMPTCMPEGLKRASALMSGHEPPCECWELNTGPLEESK